MRSKILHALMWAMLLSLAISLTTHSASAKERKKDTWRKVETKHVLIMGNIPEKKLRTLAEDFERFHQAIYRLFPKFKTVLPQRVSVLVFKKFNTYRLFLRPSEKKNRLPDKWYWHAHHGNYLALPTSGLRPNPKFYFRSYVRLMFRQALPGIPLWTEEGLGELFQAFSIRKNGKYLIAGHSFRNLRPFPHNISLLEFEKLLSANRDHPPYLGRDLHHVLHEPAFVLVHFLIYKKKGKDRPQFNRFLKEVACGTPGQKALEKVFSKNFASFRNEVNKHGNSLQGNWALQVELTQPIEMDIPLRVSTMNDAEVKFYLGDLYRNVRKFEEAEAHLKQSIELDPDFAPAHAALGKLYMSQNRLDESEKHLQLALQETTADSPAHHEAQQLLQRLGIEGSASPLGKPCTEIKAGEEHEP